MNNLCLLKELFNDVFVPYLVFYEVLRGKKLGFQYVGAVERAEKEGWIKVKKLTEKQTSKCENLIGSFPQLSEADSSTIILAKYREEIVCIDDSVAVKAAETIGVKHIGTLGVILESVKEGLIEKEDEEKDDNVTSRLWFLYKP
ncbi:hypothetical protein [Methanonatronarchaeum sp. AMET-Sl]|uniref:hypothetical protein n=1 Tax=Methanonatronarchaeum sp. AMET-Sl TaxID=3037654 RepID=UPI00244DBCED|nr:hypothetical protein [Methanonatronarchaeum sp. AMET-Sl]WGI17701.1 hypothetical protein QEN48_01450 [Methanonatronarchaeum sp. AMET-Sl]